MTSGLFLQEDRLFLKQGLVPADWFCPRGICGIILYMVKPIMSFSIFTFGQILKLPLNRHKVSLIHILGRIKMVSACYFMWLLTFTVRLCNVDAGLLLL